MKYAIFNQNRLSGNEIDSKSLPKEILTYDDPFALFRSFVLHPCIFQIHNESIKEMFFVNVIQDCIAQIKLKQDCVFVDDDKQDKLCYNQDNLNLGIYSNGCTTYISGNDLCIYAISCSSNFITSGNNSTICTAGKNLKIFSTGDHSLIYSNGDYNNITTSGDYAKIYSNSSCDTIQSTGHNCIIQSYGNGAIIGAYGHTVIYSRGKNAKIACSVGAYFNVGKGTYISYFNGANLARTIKIDNTEYESNTWYHITLTDVKEVSEDEALYMIEEYSK